MPALPLVFLLARTTVVTQTINEPDSTDTRSSQSQSMSGYVPIGAIVGGTLAGMILAVCVTLGWKYWGYRLSKPITKKPALLRIPEFTNPGEKFSKLSSRPSSTYSPTSSVRTRTTFIETKSTINEPQPALITPTTPTGKSHKCLLRTTPMPVAGRFSPSKLVTVQEEASATKHHRRHSKRSRRSGSTSPTVQAPGMVELGKDSVRFPQMGAPQQVYVKHMSTVTLAESYSGHAASQRLLDEDYTRARLSRASSAYSNGSESVGQVHHLSYVSHPPPRVY